MHCGAELEGQCHKAPDDNCAGICQGSSRLSSSQDAGNMHPAHTLSCSHVMGYAVLCMTDMGQLKGGDVYITAMCHL